MKQEAYEQQVARQAFDRMSEAYYRISAIDLDRNYIENLKLNEEEQEKNAVLGNDFAMAVQYCATHYVEPCYREIFLDVLSPENLKSLLNQQFGNPELTYRRKVHGEYKWVHSEIIPVENYGKGNTKIIWCVRNIAAEKAKETEFKQNMLKVNADLKEALHQAEKFKKEANRAILERTNFLSKLSHDIRIPLNSIVGLTAVAEAHMSDEQWLRNALDKIHISSEYLLALVNEVFEIDQMGNQNIRLLKESFSLTELIADMTNMLLEQAKAKKQMLSVKLYGIKHDYVIGDSLRLRQVFVNLVENAIKYTPEGGTIEVIISERMKHYITIGGRLFEEYEDSGCYECAVIDNGIGIAAENLDRIFQPFVRLKETDNSEEYGTGLGLPIVKQLVALMNGEVNVRSRVGEGSTFTITFTLEQQKEQPANIQPVIDVTQFDLDRNQIGIRDVYARDYHGKRVLLAEDNDLNRELEAEILRMAGLEVAEADNGETALKMVEQSESGYYDMIFMDISMPKMDGYTATKKIRKLNREDAETIPIVAMTASAFPEDRKRSKASGMNEHMVKPLDIQNLLRILDCFIRE